MITRYPNHYNDPTCAALVTAGGFAFLGHQGGDASQPSYVAQTRSALEATRDTLAAAGLEMTSLVQVTLWVREFTDEMRDAWDVFEEFFGDAPPARMTATTEFFDDERLVMIDGVAFAGSTV